MCVAWSADGNYICGGGGVYDDQWIAGEAVVWRAETGDRVWAANPQDVVYAACFAEGERLIAAGLDRASTCGIPATGRFSNTSMRTPIASATWLPTRVQPRVVTASDDGTVRVWDLQRQADREMIQSPAMFSVHDLAFSPGGHTTGVGECGQDDAALGRANHPTACRAG